MISESRIEFKIVEAASSDDALWDDFVAHSPQGTFFQSITWSDLIAQSFNRTCIRLYCLRNDLPVGCLILFESKKVFWKVATPTPLFPFTSPVLYKPQDERPQKTVSNYLKISSAFSKYLDKNYAFWILDAPHTFQDTRSFIWQGASVTPSYTYLVALTNKEDLINRFNQSTRKKLKLAEREDPKVYESVDPSNLIELVSKSYYRHSRNPLISEKVLDTLLNSVIKLTNADIYYLSVGDKVKSARLIVRDKQTVYDVLAGSDDETGTGSAYLITQILMKYCQSHQYFDFMGADHPEIEQFKRGFGGDLKQGFRMSGNVHFPLSTLIKLNEYRLNKKRNI